ncbi:hypothetical protein AC578_2674 [Pseudocercospora eumusae]|uniref:Uncharacterized protein n=1 Tax=Pseudocercospora eumusae TaxID=321146 RepID=A0A139H1C7_9PEZI|nr:hypothetical protein AC578_2674 [Pseudocercospora eumusae]
MTAAAQKFPWDFDKPKTAFWDDIGWKEGRAFFGAFPDDACAESTLADKLESSTDLPTDAKLQILLDILQQRLRDEEALAADRVPPSSLVESDYRAWRRLWHAIYVIKSHQGRHDEEERIIEMLMETQSSDGEKDLSAHHSMCFILVDKKRFEEAEVMCWDVLNWLDNHPMCGPSSPQSLSIRRLLVKIACQTGSRDTAKRRLGELKALVDGLAKGKFAKYAEEEKEMLLDLTIENGLVEPAL